MRLLISGGGTAGHVYPGLSVLDESAGTAEVEALWVGTRRGMERDLMRRRGLAYASVPAAPIVGVSPWRLPANCLQLLAGTLVAWWRMAAFKPHAVLVTGGYVAVPVALAAWLRRVPIALYLPDASPGRAVRLISRFASLVMTSVDAAATSFQPGTPTTTVGYPVRPGVRSADRASSRRRLDLPESGSVLLVFGGSQGAEQLNRVTVAGLEALLSMAHVVHVTGTRNLDRVSAAKAGLIPDLAERYHVFGYLDDDDMAAALAAADLAVSRAGAAVMGEYPARGLPSVLVPLDLAGRHQALNAAVLAEKGAAIVVSAQELTPARMAEVVGALLTDPSRLFAMSRAARTLDRPNAAADTLRQVVALAGKSGAGARSA